MAKAAATRRVQKWNKETQVKTVHVTMLIDRSGSMQSIRSDVIGGFNSFLRDQQAEPGDCYLTVHQFDTGGVETLFSGLEIKQVREAEAADFLPRGGTPLLDAIGRTITEAQIRCESHPDEQPIIVILTDGEENSSHEYTNDAIRKLIAAKEALGWVFTYLGANQDAFAVARRMGIAMASTQSFVPDSVGTFAGFASNSSSISNARNMAAAGTPVASSNYLVDDTAQVDYVNRTTTTSSTPAEPKAWKKS